MTGNQAADSSGKHPQQETGRIIRAIGLGAGPVAAPFIAVALQPVLGAAVLAGEMILVLVVLGIVVYGTQDQAERAFRLLRWLRSQPEPPAPTLPVKGRAHRS